MPPTPGCSPPGPPWSSVSGTSPRRSWPRARRCGGTGRSRSGRGPGTRRRCCGCRPATGAAPRPPCTPDCPRSSGTRRPSPRPICARTPPSTAPSSPPSGSSWPSPTVGPERILTWSERWRARALQLRPRRVSADPVLAEKLDRLRTINREIDHLLVSGGDIRRLAREQLAPGARDPAARPGHRRRRPDRARAGDAGAAAPAARRIGAGPVRRVQGQAVGGRGHRAPLPGGGHRRQRPGTPGDPVAALRPAPTGDDRRRARPVHPSRLVSGRLGRPRRCSSCWSARCSGTSTAGGW